jgi:hypothetical protein
MTSTYFRYIFAKMSEYFNEILCKNIIYIFKKMLAKITVHLREKYGYINLTSIFEKMSNFRNV